MRSCLRRPLAPGRSRDRAILVSSVMFFSLSSAMVIDHLQRDLKGGAARKTFAGVPRGWRTGWLGSPSLRLSEILWFRQNGLPFRNRNLIQNLIHGFLN